jgi:DNA invertase Pin-like site-specific DNA recombinase
VKKRGRKPKLSPEQIKDVREMYANKTDPIGWSVPAIARVMGVSVSTIHKALNQHG